MVNEKTRFGGFAGARGWVFELSGGRLCLDFANTVDRRPSPEPRELLPAYAELVSWARQTGILTPREARDLSARARRHRARASRALSRAHELREALYRIFATRARGGPALEELRSWLAAAFGHPELRTDSGYRLVFRDDLAHFEGLLSPIVRSAVELLEEDALARVRQCAADECAWLFLDESKNGSRQWCDMTVCGNRAKARRFYARKRAARRRRARPATRPSAGKP
jgi:predicted RNA-binding Zn ribbon-like protein